jgi:hypothetical protein
MSSISANENADRPTDSLNVLLQFHESYHPLLHNYITSLYFIIINQEIPRM